MDDNTVWCRGVSRRVSLDKTCEINGRTVYNGVFCDTGEPVDPDDLVGSTFQEILRKLGSLPPEAQDRVNQFIEDQFSSDKFDE